MNPKPTREGKAFKRMKGRNDLELLHGINEKWTHMYRAHVYASFPRNSMFISKTHLIHSQHTFGVVATITFHSLESTHKFISWASEKDPNGAKIRE